MSALRRVQITGRAALLIAAALFVAVTAIRFAFADPTNGVGLFYVVPIALVAEPSEVVGFENRFRSAGGDWLWLSWTSRSDGHRIYAVAKDITERKRADELRDARLVQAEAEAHADDLTGLLNRRAWDLELT